jgi:predicted transcriptional regulator
MEKLWDLLFELSNEDRFKIVLQLDEKAMNVTNLAKKLKLSMQEVSRHVSRLHKTGLIAKNVTGRYNVTSYGKLVMKQLPGLEFISKHRDYFNSHSVTHLPLKFVSRINELAECTFTDDVMVFFHGVAKGIQEAEECIWVIVDQFLMSHVSLVKDALERKVKMRTIEPKSWIAPFEFYRIREEAERTWAAQARKKGFLEHRALKRVEIYLHMSEKKTALAFPTLDGAFDHLGFISTDKRSLKWCKNLFDYYWERAESLHKPLRGYSQKRG